MRALTAGLIISSLMSFAAAPRDPFAKSEEPLKPTPSCTTSLCRQQLTDLKLVAIVSGSAQPIALFENQLGQGFVARRHVQVGSGGARVTQIDRDCVTLTRFSTAADGHYQPVTERLCVAKRELAVEHDYLTDGPYQIP